MIYDADGQPVDFRYLEINPAFEQLTGITAQDVIGKTVREAIPGIEPYWIETYGKVALTGEPAQFENYVSAINKYYQVFAFRPQKNQFAALFIDITQRKQIEQALQKAHDQAIGLARFPDEDPNPVMRVNADGRVLYSNPAAKNNPGWECIDRQQVPDPLLPLIYEALAKEEGTEQDVLLGDRCYSVSIMPFVRDGYVNLYGWDVTDRRQAENELRRSEVTLRESEAQLRQSTEALRESEQKFSLIFEKSAFAAVLTTFPEAILVSVNEAWENILGYTRQEAIGKTSVELGINPDTGNRADLIDQVIKNGTLHGIEMPLRTRSGERRVALLNIDVIEIGRERFFLNTMIDITERKQTEDALERALNDVENEKNRLLAIMEALPIGVVIVDAQGGIVQANQEYDRVWGGPYPKTLSVADYGPFKAWWVDTGEPVQPEEWASAQAVQKGEAVMGQLMEIQRFDGTHGIVLNSGAPIRDAQGQIVGCAVGIMDITEQKRLETEQREHHIQMEIQRRLLEYREQERQALARDLHDGPVQDLSSLLFNIQFAKEAITDPAIKVELDQIASRLKTTVQNLRETINEMRPPSLIRFGLSKAINVFLEEFQENHPDIDLDQSIMDDGNCLSEAARLGLYRILQEALTNIIKHSNAKRVAVALSCDDHQTVLEIRDEGKGFSLSDNLVDYSVHGHYGLVGMKERADAIGGTLEINSLPQKGTAIRVIMPLA